jgi:DNA-binding transcriptional ArsR family regulator
LSEHARAPFDFPAIYKEPTLSFDGMFIVKLPRPKPKTIEGATKGVKRTLTILLTAIVKNERERIPYYAEITGLSARSIERYIRQLRNANLIDLSSRSAKSNLIYVKDNLLHMSSCGRL